MLAPHLGYGPLQEQIAAILPRPRGGVAPSRREVALADYIEKQRAHRQPKPSNLEYTRVAAVLWSMILRAYRAAIQMLVRSKREAPCKGPDQRAAVNQLQSAVGRRSSISLHRAQR